MLLGACKTQEYTHAFIPAAWLPITPFYTHLPCSRNGQLLLICRTRVKHTPGPVTDCQQLSRWLALFCKHAQ